MYPRRFLALYILLLFGCSAEDAFSQSTSQTKKPRYLDVQKIDRIVKEFNNATPLYTEVDSAIVHHPKTEAIASVRYIKDFNYKGGTLYRLTAFGTTENDSAIFTYYFANHQVIKLEVEFGGIQPGKGYCYLDEGEILASSDNMSSAAIREALKTSDLMLQQINKK